MKEDIIKKIQDAEEIINNKLNANITIKIYDFHDTSNGMLVIRKDNKIDKIFEVKAISSCQIDIIMNNEVIENGLLIDYLDKWLYNLYNPVVYQYVFYGGNLSGKKLSEKEIENITIGKTPNYTELRNKGVLVHRRELDEQPIVRGYIGPMFDEIDYGVIYLRYETQEIYDMLSE